MKREAPGTKFGNDHHMMAASVFLFVLVTTPLFDIVCRLVTCITMYLVRSQYSLVQAY